MKILKFCAVLVIIVFTLILTTVASQAENINVLDYGADGMSEDDQTEFIKAAIEAAKPGDTVYIPDGTYNISSVLLPSGITFKGESREGTVLKANSEDSTVVSLRLGSGITVSDITVDGNMIAKYCLYFKSGDDNTADNVKMCNLPHKGSVIGLYINGRCRRSVVRNCLFENIGVRPTGDENEDKGTGICIYGNSMFSFPHPDDVLIENNTFNLIGRTGIAADYVDNVKIIGNLIKNTGYVIGKGLSIEIYGPSCQNCIIEDNTVDHWMSIHGNYHAVRRNRIGTDFIDGEDYYKRYAIENAARNIVYSENEISGGNKYGILDLVSGGNILYSGINVKNCTQAAYSVGECADFGGKNRRYFLNCSFNDTIKSDTLSIYPSSSGIGIEVNNRVSSFVFENVEASGNKRYGMQCKGISGQFELRGCNITGNSSTGLIFGQTNPFELNAVTVTGNGKKNTDGSFAGDSFPVPTPFAFAAPEAAWDTDKEEYTVGDTVTFTNTSATADESIVFEQYLWDLGEGLPSTEKDTSYTYSKAGVYTVSLVVWDSEGRGDICVRTITVKEPAPPEDDTDSPEDGTTEPIDPQFGRELTFIEKIIAFFIRIINKLKALFA